MSAAAALKKYWLLPCLLLIHAALQWSHLRLDFWNDELYTLDQFVFTPAWSAAGDYHSTNNHILFSLLAQAWSACLGINSLAQAISCPLLLRLFPFLVSCATVVLIYRAGFRIGGPLAAMITAVILITSIPFYNYASQMRGYGLSMALYAALANAIILAWRKQGILPPISIGALSVLSLYTLPSNLYFILALMLAVVFTAGLMRKEDKHVIKGATYILYALSIGIFISVLLYLPLRPQMQRLPIFSSGTAQQSLEAIRERLPVVAYHFLSARCLLLLPLLLFIGLPGKGRWLWTVSILVIFLLPFLLADARGNSTPYRVFLTGLPLFCLAGGIAIASVLSLIGTSGWRYLSCACIAVYCLGTCLMQIAKTDAAALRDIENGQRSGDLYFQYNLHYFHPKEDAALYLTRFYKSSIPLVEACRMDEEALKYLSAAGWDRAAAKQLTLVPALAIHDTIDVLTERPAALQDSLTMAGLHLRAIQLMPGPRAVQIMRLTKQ